MHGSNRLPADQAHFHSIIECLETHKPRCDERGLCTRPFRFRLPFTFGKVVPASPYRTWRGIREYSPDTVSQNGTRSPSDQR
jgi:hypothetical protein